MAYEVVATAEFDALLDEAVGFRIDNYGLRSASRLLDAIDKLGDYFGSSEAYSLPKAWRQGPDWTAVASVADGSGIHQSTECPSPRSLTVSITLFSAPI